MNNFFLDTITRSKDQKTYKFLSGGEWLESDSGETIDILSPIDDSLVGRIQAITKKEVDVMITQAAVAQKTWAEIKLAERSKILHKAAELMDQHKETLAELLCLEVGKPIADSRSEVSRSVDFIHYTADQTDWADEFKVAGDVMKVGGSSKKTFYGKRIPLGVVLAISPFNYPVNLAISKIAPALLCGNTVVVKGPTQGSVITIYLVEVFRKAGVIDGAISCATGRGSEIGDMLVTHELIDFIAFTGSSGTGKDIAKKAGMVGMLMELGGKDAAIVLDSADVVLAASEIARGAFSYAGQRCTAVKRVFLHNDIADEFIEALIGKTKELFSVVGDPRNEKTKVGPLISDRQADFVESLVQDALAKGAKELLTGVRRGRYFPPTILDNVTKNIKIAHEEQFGPVLPIIRIKNIKEAIDGTNASEYGLEASVFSRDEDQAREVAESLEVGIVQINAKPERAPDHFPFLGVKDSGIGVQGIGPTIEAMTTLHGIVINKTK